MSQEVVILLVSGIAAAIIAAVVAYVATRNVEAAVLKAVESFLGNAEWLETVEYEIDENIPEDVQTVIMAFVLLGERLAEGTATEADDKLIDLLKEVLGEDVSA
jgi:hypothetical protein